MKGMRDLLLFCRNFAGFSQLGPGEMYRVPGGYPQATLQGPRSLHFRGKRPIPRLLELVSARSSARPLSAAARLATRIGSRPSVSNHLIISRPACLEMRIEGM